MQGNKVKYTIKAASEDEIYLHLLECNNNFKPPLSEKVKVDEYSKKIFNKALSFEAWNNTILSGLLAVYFDDINKFAFITNVSVLKNSISCGIASQLMKMCIEYASNALIKEIKLEVNQKNIQAIGLYRKFNFRFTETNGEEYIMKLAIV